MASEGDPEVTRPHSTSPPARHARDAREWAAPDAPTHAPLRHPAAEDEPPPSHPRYEVRGILGAGGEGVVYSVYDRDLERVVALKTIRPRRFAEDGARLFLHEAHAAASLEHPNIVPVHDLGVLADGRPFYTMRLIEGRSLSAVLRSLVATGRPADDGAEWSLVRLIQVVQQACRALQLAHERGILHRDVKPSNILLGAHGEVLVVDWGIARTSVADRENTESGIVKGTIAYMSPEQACGDPLDPRSDIYSLGVVLYQVITLRLPFNQTTDAELLAAVLRDPPPRPDSITGVRIPSELSDLAIRALSKDPAKRPASALAFHDELQSYVEGIRDRERRRLRADAFCQRGEAALAVHHSAQAEVERLAADVERLERLHKPWEPIAGKQDLIDARRRLDVSRDAVESTFLDAVDAFTDALAHLADHGPARKALADMYWQRFVAAERSGDAPLARTCKAVVERFHDGRLARELQGDGLLELQVMPKDAEITLHPLVERDLVLVDGPGRVVGRGSVHLELPMGSYVVVARAPGHEPARYPVCIERTTHWKGELKLLPEGSLPEGFVYIPGAEVWLGGDGKAINGWPLRRVGIASFAMATHPVTFGEYCDFLDALAAQDEGSAEPRVPKLEETRELCARSAAGRYEPLGQNVGAGEADLRRVPVIGVNQGDAEAMTDWLSRKTGRVYRLPSAPEREFVARGADRRIHPWGNTFDAALCHMRDSQSGQLAIREVGAFPTDCSVHGVHDLAGCMQELTASYFDAEKRLVEVRGGSWAAGPPTTRGGWRGACTSDVRNMQLGFRLALDV